MWFEKLMGFQEESPENVRSNIAINGNQLISKVTGDSFQYGVLGLPSLAELRQQVDVSRYDNRLTIKEIVGNVQHLHQDSGNAGALFQAASQFNLLEMASPSVIPESGIDRYEHDHTQGPACAIACGAGTIYRNYFVNVKGRQGQTADNQIDCLADIATALDNESLKLWTMQNGYVKANEVGLYHINDHLNQLDAPAYDELKSKLRIGIQWNTEVTLAGGGHQVTQAYCSALPVAYNRHDAHLWEKFARMILEATYEATVLAGLINYQQNGNKDLFLTLVGGGAFGNRMSWILESLESVIRKYQNLPLALKVVSYGSSDATVNKFTKSFN
ncbi:MAG: hypothetical protein AAFQ94_27400 [Bacteroidota bacterium]